MTNYLFTYGLLRKKANHEMSAFLKAKAQFAMNEWQRTIKAIVQKGIIRKELKETDINKLSTTIIASLEGAVMLAKLYSDHTFVGQVIEHLNKHIDSLALAQKA